MSTSTVKKVWLEDKDGAKIAPKTLVSQVQTPEGILLEDKIQSDLNTLKEEILSETQGGTSIKDWNVNDETNPAYIQNRPFYTTDPHMTTVVNIAFTGNYAETTNYVFTKENTYTVIHNGITYADLVPYEYTFEGDLVLCIGDSYDTLGTNYPFSIEIYPEYENNLAYYNTTSDGDDTIEIKAIASVDIQLDEKYISYVAGRRNANVPGAEIFNNYVMNVASGNYSHAEGDETTASGQASHAEGSGTTASGYWSHAEGGGTTASGDNSHAEGTSATASGNSSHAEGIDTTASGSYSHAEGYGTTAFGIESHAEGWDTTASGQASHAEGHLTIASGNSSHAEGRGTAANRHQHVQGKYNVLDGLEVGDDGSYIKARNPQYAHIVGNGDYESSRSNAHTLDWDGNAWFAGDVYVGSTSGTNKDEGSKKLATEEYVNSKLGKTGSIKYGFVWPETAEEGDIFILLDEEGERYE